MREYPSPVFEKPTHVQPSPGGWLRRSFVVLVLLAAPLTSMALDEVNHRYDVWGEVLDDQSVPVANTEVRITGLAGVPLGEGATDATGRYRIQLHVHDANNGLRFWVTANGTTRGARVAFDFADRLTPREHRIDIGPPGASTSTQ